MRYGKVKRPSPALVASYAAAMKLDRLGMPVLVERPNGQLEQCTLATLPWTLRTTGEWVATVQNLAGESCTRSTALIRPVAPVQTRALAR